MIGYPTGCGEAAGRVQNHLSQHLASALAQGLLPFLGVAVVAVAI